MTRFKEFFNAAPVLTVTAAVMIIDLLVCIAGLLFDHTIITGMPAWIKPTKFAVSTGIYALSLVAIIRYTPIWKKTLRIAEFLIGFALTVEIILIDLQAWRHTTSHFNVATPFDAFVWTTMAVGIGIFWFSSLVVAAAAFRTRYSSRVWTIAVRYGMLLAVVGSGSGVFMTVPSHAQLERAHETKQMPIAGSHTIGGPDGGRGIPVLGWSTEHGDGRVAHFVGLHGLQSLALVAWFLQQRRVRPRKAVRIISVTACSYSCFFLIVLSEALMKDPITDRGAVFTTIWILWAVLSTAFFIIAQRNDGMNIVDGQRNQAVA